MSRLLVTMVAALTLGGGSLLAHHSYGMFYFLDQHVTLKGKVTKIVFAEPHVKLTIETRNSGTWEAEWTSPANLSRQSVAADTVKVGDVLEVDGCPPRNAEWRTISALNEIRRPADGWRWWRADSEANAPFPAPADRVIE